MSSLEQAMAQRAAMEQTRAGNAGGGGAGPQLPAGGDSAVGATPQQPQVVKIPIAGGNDGTSDMHTGKPNTTYPNLHFAPHVDWTHVTPALLQAIDTQARKMNVVATVVSGYRHNDYNASLGGTPGDGHTKGTAVDAYINGHPIGEVIPPAAWEKMGIESGINPTSPGRGDPAHLELTHIPLKQGATSAGSR